MRRSSFFLVGSMALRLLMSLIMLMVFVMEYERGTTAKLMELKMSVFVFSLPFYGFFMVSVSLLCSAHTFYTSLRNVLFP